MKKLFILACAIGALIACERKEISEPARPSLNEGSEDTIPVRLLISGDGMQTRATEANPNESALANVHLTVEAWGSSSLTPAYTETFDLGSDRDVIINMKSCQYANFIVESGQTENGEYLSTLEGQKDYLYAMGKTKVTWEQMQSQDTPFEIKIARLINKITIEKISVNWSNSNYDSREFKIKKIYLSDVPREYMSSTAGATIKGYNSSYTGTKEGVKIYNFGGLTKYEVKCNNDGKMYSAPVYRLDDQLVDEVDAVVTRDKPYTTPHTFYAYISNSSKENTHISSVSTISNYASLYIPMTTIVVQAELDGEVMYYKFPVVTDMDQAPTNTHIKFSELIITESGSTTQNGTKTYENFTYSFSDWSEDNRSDSTTNL